MFKITKINTVEELYALKHHAALLLVSDRIIWPALLDQKEQIVKAFNITFHFGPGVPSVLKETFRDGKFGFPEDRYEIYMVGRSSEVD